MLIFLLLCIAVFWFLHKFTATDKNAQYISWESAVQLHEDGSETPYDPNDYSNAADISGTYRFTALLPEIQETGCLLFELSGEELTLYLNGDELYHSSAAYLEGNIDTAQAQIPLKAGDSGELVMICTILDNTNAMFPPMLRFLPDGTADTQAYLYANLYGIPAGASALAMLLIAGLFLLGIPRGKIDWSLIPLFVAAAWLTVFPIVQSLGYYFLPEKAVQILTWRGLSWLTPAALVVYLLMNRRRNFWHLLKLAAMWSSGALLVCYLVSLATGGYLADYLHSQITALFQTGYYDGLLVWFTRWLSIVAAFISAYMVMRSFADQQANNQALVLKNQLLLNSYRTLEKNMRAGAAVRHEFKHQLTAIDSLYQQNNMQELGNLLEKIKKQASSLSQTRFTDNFTINTILQGAAARAAQDQISFTAQVHAPADLSIPENDLCILLMNMTDNALEACSRAENSKDLFIRFYAEVRGGVFAVKCENSYNGKLCRDSRGRLLTTKQDPENHGLGISQMAAVVKKYGGSLDMNRSTENTFIVQAALHLP